MWLLAIVNTVDIMHTFDCRLAFRRTQKAFQTSFTWGLHVDPQLVIIGTAVAYRKSSSETMRVGNVPLEELKRASVADTAVTRYLTQTASGS